MTMRSCLRAVLVAAVGAVSACVLAADTAVRTFGTNGTTRVLLHPSNNTAGEKNVVNPRAPGVRISSAHPRYFETADAVEGVVRPH